MNFPSQIKTALHLLGKSGFEAYLVGGCVRDHLLQRPQKDFDITTDAEPKQICETFKDFKVIETGLKHGTVTLLIDGLPVEVTTFRIDGEYQDSRRPESVRFCKSLKEDLARRDFTMNAVCFGNDGYIDYFGGIADIENKIIRAVGEAEKRFEEDALRILRALRFASVLGFAIEEKTEKALFSKKELLKNISAERIADELEKILTGEFADRIFLKYYAIFGIVIPEILPMANFDQHTKYHCFDVLTHTVNVIKNIPAKPHLRLAALLHDIGKPSTFSMEKGVGHFYGHAQKSMEIADEICKRLKFDNFTKERVQILIKYHDLKIEPTEKIVKRWLNKLTPEIFFELLDLKKADCLSQSKQFLFRLNDLNILKATAEKILQENQCFSLKDLKINGDDLIASGLQGKEIGEKLQEILSLVMDGKLENNREEILKFVFQ